MVMMTRMMLRRVISDTAEVGDDDHHHGHPHHDHHQIPAYQSLATILIVLVLFTLAMPAMLNKKTLVMAMAEI